MKRNCLLVVLLLLGTIVAAQAPAPALDIPRNTRNYFVGFLVRGEDRTPLSPDLFKKHLAYIRSQVEAGKYVLVGPSLTRDGSPEWR